MVQEELLKPRWSLAINAILLLRRGNYPFLRSARI